ncbi:hypothetical protein [Sorangium sp. So ce233]|uniref:hypothetical protein n=1 Tax=Sorangium sp. So ce233 TaxID=3133290 RepID=UPI003F60FBE3
MSVLSLIIAVAPFSFAIYRLVVLARGQRRPGQPLDRAAVALAVLRVARDAPQAWQALLAFIEKLFE